MIYYYPERMDGILRYDVPIHISMNDTILCGQSLVKGPISKRDRALPGYKLCENCVTERDRLLKGDPSEAQVITWWYGGQAEYRKEKEIMKSNSWGG